MTEIRIRTNSGIETIPLPPEDNYFQPYLPSMKPKFPLELALGMPDKSSVEDIADYLIVATNQKQLPVDIDGILRYLGVSTITYHNDLDCLGSIEDVQDNYFIVRMRADQKTLEHRFTLGHELGHLILHYSGYPISQYRELFGYSQAIDQEERWQRGIAHRKVENFCDDFSRTILFSRNLLMPRFKQIQDRDFVHYDNDTGTGRYELNGEVIALFEETQLPPFDFVKRLTELGLWEGEWPLRGLLYKYQKEVN